MPLFFSTQRKSLQPRAVCCVENAQSGDWKETKNNLPKFKLLNLQQRLGLSGFSYSEWDLEWQVSGQGEHGLWADLSWLRLVLGQERDLLELQGQGNIPLSLSIHACGTGSTVATLAGARVSSDLCRVFGLSEMAVLLLKCKQLKTLSQQAPNKTVLLHPVNSSEILNSGISAAPQ